VKSFDGLYRENNGISKEEDRRVVGRHGAVLRVRIHTTNLKMRHSGHSRKDQRDLSQTTEGRNVQAEVAVEEDDYEDDDDVDERG
jgi:hypothetical protein